MISCNLSVTQYSVDALVPRCVVEDFLLFVNIVWWLSFSISYLNELWTCQQVLWRQMTSSAANDFIIVPLTRINWYFQSRIQSYSFIKNLNILHTYNGNITVVCTYYCFFHKIVDICVYVLQKTDGSKFYIRFHWAMINRWILNR